MSDYLLDFFSLCVFAFFFLCRVRCPVYSAVVSWLRLVAQVMCLSLAWESWEAWPASWDFSGWLPFFLPRTCFEPGALFLGEHPPGALSLQCCGRRGQPGAFLDVILHLLARGGYGTKAGSTWETRIVMHADNMVKVGRIVLDGVRAKWTTRHAWAVPRPWLLQAGK